MPGKANRRLSFLLGGSIFIFTQAETALCQRLGLHDFMARKEAPMRIEMHMTSREVYAFDMSSENPKALLNQIKPKELFHRPLHQFLGKVRTVSVNPALIEWIVLDTMEMPDTLPLMRSLKIRQLSADLFRQRVSTQKGAILTLMESDRLQQNTLLAYGKATFTSGRILYAEIQTKMERMADRLDISQRIFSLPALFVEGELSGLLVVNPCNIAVWQVVPGLKKGGRFSLPAELTDVDRGQNDG
jgi:hypothetical protein